MARHCPECGFVVTEGANYCAKCGAYLGATEQARTEDATTATYVIDESTGELRPVDVGDVDRPELARRVVDDVRRRRHVVLALLLGAQIRAALGAVVRALDDDEPALGAMPRHEAARTRRRPTPGRRGCP